MSTAEIEKYDYVDTKVEGKVVATVSNDRSLLNADDAGVFAAFVLLLEFNLYIFSYFFKLYFILKSFLCNLNCLCLHFVGHGVSLAVFVLTF